MPAGAFPISEHLSKLQPALRATVQAARWTVKGVAPKAQEIAYRSRPPSSSRSMWKIVHYRLEGAYVVGIGTYPDHASLFFLRGRELDDGSGLLQGGGKAMRFVTLRAPADVERGAVKRLVRKAFRLAGIANRGAPPA
ncbi:MAG TPA: DUF1801 domain-containing protein [Anaeromyxobacteraceae bacterium]|nr:DUF1801 domain-containing protein [Anaeromyxobacteraceae bacterium]